MKEVNKMQNKLGCLCVDVFQFETILTGIKTGIESKSPENVKLDKDKRASSLKDFSHP